MANRKYALIVNPKAGLTDVEGKKRKLKSAMEILGVSQLYGLDTNSAEEFRECARSLAESGKFDCLVGCGGDGTNSDLINAEVDIPLAFLGLGNGNAASHSFGISARNIEKAARAIDNGTEHCLDLILCRNDEEEVRAMFASVGIEAYILNVREGLQKKGHNGLFVYAKATWDAYNNGYTRLDARVSVDGDEFLVTRNLTTVVAKSPFYGYGMNVIPRANLSDGKIHVLAVSDEGMLRTARGIIGCFVGGNITKAGKPKIGKYVAGEKVCVDMPEEVLYQTDGTVRGKGKHFEFEVLQKAVKFIY